MEQPDEGAMIARFAQLIADARAFEQGGLDDANRHRQALEELFAGIAKEAHILAAAFPNEMEATEGFIAAQGERTLTVKWKATSPERWLQVGMNERSGDMVMAWRLPRQGL